MKTNKRNTEVVSASFEIDGFSAGVNSMVNVEVNKRGEIVKRLGFNTFGEMVDVLWNINKRAKKIGFTGDYTIRLPLKGTKPIYKKTLRKQ